MTTAPDTEPVIEISGLDFSYNPQQPILTKVNISVEQFTSTCIVGPNGGGKSTLVKLILGLLRPNRGRVLLLGGPPKITRSQVGYVPQYAKFDPL
ncbi:MAG: ATP-binding cassette domain-containing protein, partial [Deltaproteobacteria bacterium]|nr:ATP-binding cassette domain-containing protein [Deltaproteobacteria bacterium]